MLEGHGETLDLVFFDITTNYPTKLSRQVSIPIPILVSNNYINYMYSGNIC